MNHHQFRQFIQRLPADKIKQSNINPAHFKAVCFVLSMYGDFKSGTSIKPSWLTVSREAGVDRKTAMKVRDFLLANDLLVQSSKTEGNISVYFFGELSTLNEHLSNFDDQLSNIDGHNSTLNTTLDITNDVKYLRVRRKGNSKINKVEISTSLDGLLPVSGIYKEEEQ